MTDPGGGQTNDAAATSSVTSVGTKIYSEYPTWNRHNVSGIAGTFYGLSEHDGKNWKGPDPWMSQKS